MAVSGLEAVPGNCGEALYIPESSGEDQSYMNHMNDNFYTKFKIDPNELYTFHDSDVIAGEITVSHTEDSFVYPESVDIKSEDITSPVKEQEIVTEFTNGDAKEEVKKNVLSNGHYLKKPNKKDVFKPPNSMPKVHKPKILNFEKDALVEAHILTFPNPDVETGMSPPSVNSNGTNAQSGVASKPALGETFLDVFKREQGLVENAPVVVKTEPQATPTPPPAKIPSSPPKKISSGMFGL